jgi:H+/Cl- antiporter ClcA
MFHGMKKIIAFLLLMIGTIVIVAFSYFSGNFPTWLNEVQLWLFCALFGGLGGCIYCLRAVYLNACVNKNWDKEWEPWYYIRPFVSVGCGFISCLFMKAGLLVAEASQSSNSSNLGFYTLAFIAGLNVDKFIAKVEEIAQATWGIEKSRTAKDSEKTSNSSKQ